MIQILEGDCREVLKTLDAQSVNCCVTSPPYFGLRQYFADAVRIKVSLTPEKKAWVEQQLREAGVYAQK